MYLPGVQSLLPQYAEVFEFANPFIGKVNPPFGPWKDKITIAEMGPYKNNTNSPKKEANQ